jgi:PUB domain
MELRRAEEEIRSLSTLYASLYQSTRQDSELPFDLPALAQESPNTGTAVAEATPDDAVTTIHSAVDAMQVLDSFHDRLDALHNMAEKFRQRLAQCDPFTNRPRYGEQTSKRVQVLLTEYRNLCRVAEIVFGEGTPAGNNDTMSEEKSTAPLVDMMREVATTEIERRRQQEEEERLRLSAQEEARLAAMERALREQAEAIEARARLERQAAEAEAHERDEARRASQLAQEQAAAADRAWIQSIPNRKSLQGVREQLQIFSESSNMESLTALHTIFSQITSHPEEVNFRRIRRDHPRFEQDIGQYPGGKELLIAAGFELGFVEEIPSYICKEPNVEKDLDGWSAWFDLLKGTLELIEAEMMK